MSTDTDQLLDIAVAAAKAAGDCLMGYRGRLEASAIDEKARNDLVTVADRASEQLIVEHLRRHFPDHAIVAEEGSGQTADSPYRWFIDPLDGTTNFVRNIPAFCVSIALEYHRELLLGVVWEPVHRELFTAVKGRGASLNGRPIRVSEVSDFGRAFLATGFPHHSKRYLPLYVQSFADIYLKAAGARRIGSAALDLCYTACGRFDGFWELGLHSWDIAAGSLIVQEAGGVVTDFRGGPAYLESGFVAAGNPAIHRRLISILSTYFRRPDDG
ncbi:MAG: inositol monophosphatase [Calditrichaeota bacterium]|nr:MAG: inositol monophosphatase [Calditrichota bacterium]